jgi:putative transposase
LLRIKPKRYTGRGDLHFITFSCYQRRQLLATAAERDLFVKILGEVRERYEFQVFGYVVMPEHVHLLISEPECSTPSRVLQVLKQRVSRELRGKPRGASGEPFRFEDSDEGSELRRFWQRRFYDFNVYSQEKAKEKLNYMHANPVERKLVEHPKDWPWSSFLFYATGDPGLIAIDALNSRREG